MANGEHVVVFRELMSMLGTPKPSVVSDEDIEKADLEVFKAKAMPAFEQEGKIASISMENVSR